MEARAAVVGRREAVAAILYAASPRLNAAERPHVAFVTGDDEYRSEFSMPMIARILEASYGMRTSIAYARPTPQTATNIEGLEALRDADLAVFFLRWRRLPDEQLRLILDYVNSGKPIAGFRTSTHTFKYPAGSPHEHLNDGFGRDVFGQTWIRHHGHLSTTEVSQVPEQSGHPILRGVAREFKAPSWLYVVNPLHGDCVPLLTGRAVNPQGGRDYGPQPVAWTKTYKGARVFFTTLGHPEDFKLEPFRKLAINGLLWSAGKQVPRGGADARIQGEYNPPPSGVPKPAK
ncbi:MAG: ThuA domain-containing protein [Acidobacteria bacterium]|nr:ThuA domain-containing protein [Acidobacteriota bacterium]